MNAVIEKVLFPGQARKNEDYPVTKRHNFLPGEELGLNIRGCVLNDRLSQKRIYTSFYNYAMTICSLHSNNYDDAVEILNDGFLKIFKGICRYRPAYPDTFLSFKGWLRKIMVRTAIDHFRKNRRYRLTTIFKPEVPMVSAKPESASDRISYSEIISSMQKLTPGYRVILNLFVIESFSHEQISKQLGISIGTSKSNLTKGRKQLQKLLFYQNQIRIPQNDSRSGSFQSASIKMGQ